MMMSTLSLPSKFKAITPSPKSKNCPNCSRQFALNDNIEEKWPRQGMPGGKLIMNSASPEISQFFFPALALFSTREVLLTMNTTIY